MKLQCSHVARRVTTMSGCSEQLAAMLKRGSRSGGSSRRNRPVDSLSERESSPRSRSSSPRVTRRKSRKGRSRESNSDKGSSDDADKKARLKKAERMKRAPLLDYAIVEAVYSAMAGQAQRRASRHWLEQFAKYEEAKRPGVIKAEKFTRCLNRMGIELDKREHYEALADCFKSGDDNGGDSDSSDNNNKKESARQLVDYAAFVDFACNVRDSEKLSEIAEGLRESISKYDGKKQSSTSYNIAAGLEKLDRHKRGWITSTQFERALQRQDQGPTFHLSAAQVGTLVNRFEYEYEKQQLGIDYMQFAQWLQPLLHLDVKKMHDRIKSLIEDAEVKHGWKLDEVFKAMDDNKDGEIDAVELKEALLEMGLPLTDAQIRCLADEYDVDGDGEIQYSEFLSMFASPNKKRVEVKKKRGLNSEWSGNKSDTGSTTDLIKKKRNRPKRNVRNSFSWGITKAFARKQAAKTGNRNSISRKNAGKGNPSNSSEEHTSEGRQKKKVAKQRKDRDATSMEEEVDLNRATRRRQRSRNQHSDLSEEEKSVSSSAPEDQGQRGSKAKLRPKARQDNLSSTESEKDNTRRDVAKKKIATGRRTLSKKNTAAESGDESKKRESSDSEEPKRESNDRSGNTRPERSFRDKPTRRRSQRFASDEAPRSRSRQNLSRRRHRSRSRSYNGRRQMSPQRRRNISRSRPRRLHRMTPKNVSRDEGDDEFPDNNDSSSGLDVEQLRKRKKTRGQRVIRRSSYAASDDNMDEEPFEHGGSGLETSEDDNGGDEWSRSDEEYHIHLKRSLRRAFDFFDLDQTSTIDKRELTHVLRALGHEFTSKELDTEMANADLDRNGQLDFYEFVAFVKQQLAQKTYLLSQQREMEIRQSFQSLDTDKNGALDEQEFEYLIYKVLQVELSVEEQDALLDFVDKDADGLISEDEFIAFMKKLETLHRKYSGKGGWKKQKRFLDSLDVTSQLAYSAMKKLVRGAPMDIDRNLLMFFGIPSNFRPAMSSAATCRNLHVNTMEHVLSFPSPQTIEALALDTRLNDKKDSSWITLNRLDTSSDEYRMLQQAEGVEAQAIVSLKRAAGVPKPFDTREDDVVKRCVHVCLFQEQEEVAASKAATARRRRNNKPAATSKDDKVTGAGSVVGNVHEIPVYWHQGEEDVWEFSKKSTKQDKYKFLVRTNAVNDHLYLLVEFIVHLKLNPEEHRSNKRSKRQKAVKNADNSGNEAGPAGGTREMVCCWCKIPVRQLLAKRSDIVRRKEKLWGGTANAPVDIEQDELLRRRTGWRAFTSMFSKPSPPLMGIKSAPIDSLSEELQLFVRKMPPVVIAPFVSLPILAEYMVLVRNTLARVTSSSSVMTCEPALKLLPKIVDDHVALSIFRKAFDSEVAGMKPGEDRQVKFQQLVLRMWPSFVHWQERLPPSLLPAFRLPGLPQASKAPESAPPKGVSAASTAATREVDEQVAAQMRLNLLQTTASGKLRLQDVRVASAPFHVREVAFRRLL